MSEIFLNKLSRYRRWEDAQLSLMGRVLLLEGMGIMNEEIKEEKIRFTAYKKPYIENSEVKFNISHSGQLVVCALVRNAQLGVDIEEMQDVNLEDFKFQMTPNEWISITRSDDQKEAFYNYWTQKEAVIKAHGSGLSIPLDSFEILNNRAFIQTEAYFLKELEISKNYKCHLAIDHEIDDALIQICQIKHLERHSKNWLKDK